jgi:carbamate kinase
VSGPTVVAIGGNALARRRGPDDIDAQRRNAAAAAASLARLDAPGGLVVTHGNGPQVGMLALGAEATGRHTPMAVLVAQSQGHVGHLLQAELAVALGGRPVATVLTHVELDPADPALAKPTKPIGPMLTEAGARAAAAEHGWRVAPDGDGWRRVVASPQPAAVVELAAIGALGAAGHVVVCAGGGGIPVGVAGDGSRLDLEAVVDKDLTSALLAVELDARALVILTDVDGVHRSWPPNGRPAAAIGRMTVAELRGLRLDAGTMAPKALAACRFAEATGRPAHIGPLERAAEVAEGLAGTTVVP